MSQPKFSILIPVYNREQVIAETLESLLAQTFQDWECILVDDGSTDATANITERYCTQDKRFRYYKRAAEYKAGGCGARNYAYTLSTGEYIKWLDSDDLLYPELLEKENNKFLTVPDLHMVYSGHTNNISKETKCLNPTLLQQDPMTGIALLNLIGQKHEYLLTGCYSIKRELIQRTGLWNEDITINQDGEFIFRLLSYCKLAAPINYIGFNYRLDNDNKITSNYNDTNKIRKKLKSWELIDASIKLRRDDDLRPYISGMKDFLYKYHLHLGHIEIVAEFFQFFQQQIKQEKRKGIKFKLIRLIAQQTIKNYL